MWVWRRREEKERAAAAAADAAEAQSAPAAEGKEAADKAAKKLEGNARCGFAGDLSVQGCVIIYVSRWMKLQMSRQTTYHSALP